MALYIIRHRITIIDRANNRISYDTKIKNLSKAKNNKNLTISKIQII